MEAFIQGLVTRFERYLQYRYFIYDLLTTDELTKYFVDTVTSSGRVGLAVWAWVVLGAWVSDSMLGVECPYVVLAAA